MNQTTHRQQHKSNDDSGHSLTDNNCNSINDKRSPTTIDSSSAFASSAALHEFKRILTDFFSAVDSSIVGVPVTTSRNVTSPVVMSQQQQQEGKALAKERVRINSPRFCSTDEHARGLSELQVPLEPLTSIPSPHKPLSSVVPTSPGNTATTAEVGRGGAQFRSSYYSPPSRTSHADEYSHDSNNMSVASAASSTRVPDANSFNGEDAAFAELGHLTSRNEKHNMATFAAIPSSANCIPSSAHWTSDSSVEQSLIGLGGRTPQEGTAEECWHASSSTTSTSIAFEGIPIDDDDKQTPLSTISGRRQSITKAFSGVISHGRNDVARKQHAPTSVDQSPPGSCPPNVLVREPPSCPHLSEAYSSDRQALIACHHALRDIVLKVEALRDVVCTSALWATVKSNDSRPYHHSPPLQPMRSQVKDDEAPPVVHYHTVPPASILRVHPLSPGVICESISSRPSFSQSARSNSFSHDSRRTDAITEGRVRTVSMKSLHRVLTRRAASGVGNPSRPHQALPTNDPFSSDDDDELIRDLSTMHDDNASRRRSTSRASGVAIQQEHSTSSLSYSFDRSIADSDSHCQAVAPLMTTTSAEKTVDDVGVKMLNQYVMLGTIGEGACGKVKAALNAETNATVAIKIVRRADRRKLEALRQEVSIMKLLRHKNVVALHEVIDDPGAAKLYLVMQHIDCGSVGRLRGDGTCERLPVERVLSIVRQAAAGLEYLHNHGVVHRDVKPDNI